MRQSLGKLVRLVGRCSSKWERRRLAPSNPFYEGNKWKPGPSLGIDYQRSTLRRFPRLLTRPSSSLFALLRFTKCAKPSFPLVLSVRWGCSIDVRVLPLDTSRSAQTNPGTAVSVLSRRIARCCRNCSANLRSSAAHVLFLLADGYA